MILGGVKGVGKQILLSCLNKGYNVSFCGRNAKQGEEIIASSNAKDQLYFHQLDLNKTDELKNYHDETIKKFGKIDALILYAGITPVASILDTEEDTYDSVFNVNLKAPFFLLKYVLGKECKKNGALRLTLKLHSSY